MEGPAPQQRPSVGVHKATTGVAGLDEITGGGLPAGRVTLVAGGPGTGKTLLGVTFLVAGMRDHGEPAVLLSFDETARDIVENVASLGIDLARFVDGGQLAIRSFRSEDAEVVEVGAFSLDGLLLSLGEAVDAVGARRVLIDAVDVVFGRFQDEGTVRRELGRLLSWLERRGVTAVVTGEPGDRTITRHAVEEYVSDCVIVLANTVTSGVSSRTLRVAKYRGSAHGSYEYPLVIADTGLAVLSITSLRLDCPAPTDRISTGVAALDQMLGGGIFRGSTTLLSGEPGTGKTSLGAHLVDAACARGERALVALYEDSPLRVARNMGSIGLDLQRWIDDGLLHLWRPSTYGVESHLEMLASVDVNRPAVVVVDGMLNYLGTSDWGYMPALLVRLLDQLKAREITTMVTALEARGAPSRLGVSSLMDAWVLLENIEHDGERDRLCTVVKARGAPTSKRVREFRLTDRGVALIDVCIGPEGVLTGSARRRRRDQLGHQIAADELALAGLRDRLATARDEWQRLSAEDPEHLAEG